MREESQPAAGIRSFVIAAFLWSWLLWLPGLLNSRGLAVPEVLLGIGMLAVFGPSAAALLLTWRREGTPALKQLLKRGLRCGSAKKWLWPALLLGPLTALISLGLGRLITGAAPALPSLSTAGPTAIGLIVMFFIGGPLAEEFGWRGYALDRLLKRHSPLRAGLILGVIWGVWHLPLHFINGSVQEYIPLWANLVMIITSSLLYTWLYQRTGGSVAVAMLFHWSVNAGNILFPYWQIGLAAGSRELPELWVPGIGMLIGFGVLLLTTLIVVGSGGLKAPAAGFNR